MDSPLRVALVSPGWPPESCSNGIVTYVGALRDGLRTLGHEAHVLSLGPVDETAHPGVSDVTAAAHGDPLPARALGWLRTRGGRHRSAPFRRIGRRLTRALDALEPVDLLEIEESFGIARWVAPRRAVPVVVRLHGPWAVNGPFLDLVRGEGFQWRSRSEREAARAAAGVSVPARHILDRVREAWELELPAARVIPNPAPEVAPAERWTPAGAVADRILFVGRFDRIKGADVLLRAFARLAERRPEAELVFVGPDQRLVLEGGGSVDLPGFLDAELPPAVRARLRVTGAITPAEIAGLRREAAVTVMCSRHEVFPLTVLEAMAHGCPLVASRIPALEGLAEHDGNAWLCEPESPEALAAALERLLEDPERAARLGARAAEDVARGYSVRAVAEATADFYREIVAGSGGAA